MKALIASLRRGAASAVLLVPVAAQATLHLYGPSDWHAGQTVAFEVRADANTLLEAYQVLTDDSLAIDVFAPNAVLGEDDPIATLPMSSLLQMTNDPKASLLEALPSAACNPTLPFCAFFSAFGVTIPKDTVLTRWEFLVREDSPVWDVLTASGHSFGIVPGLPPGDPFDGVDDPIEGVFYFDLAVSAVQQSDPAFLPVSWSLDPGESSTEFRVLAIPESSSWTLTLAGLLLAGVCAYRRIPV